MARKAMTQEEKAMKAAEKTVKNFVTWYHGYNTKIEKAGKYYILTGVMNNGEVLYITYLNIDTLKKNKNIPFYKNNEYAMQIIEIYREEGKLLAELQELKAEFKKVA